MYVFFCRARVKKRFANFKDWAPAENTRAPDKNVELRHAVIFMHGLSQ